MFRFARNDGAYWVAYGNKKAAHQAPLFEIQF